MIPNVFKAKEDQKDKFEEELENFSIFSEDIDSLAKSIVTDEPEAIKFEFEEAGKKVGPDSNESDEDDEV